MKRSFGLLIIMLAVVVGAARAQELAATLEVLAAGVEVQRVNTANFIAVNAEAIVGVGDLIRTDATGRARITFFADGVDTDLEPSSEYRIVRFEGDADGFNIQAEVLVGQTVQRLTRLLNAESSYNIETPAMTLVARGTEFAIRVEANGRSAMLVRDGTVEAESDESATVVAGFGVRAEADEGLSDVVRATTFEELDAALDGCAAVLTTPDDVSLNVRIGPNRDSPRIGTLDASEIPILYGQAEIDGDTWYRIEFAGSFGWTLSSAAAIAQDCNGLRQFEPDYVGEDASLYTSLDPGVDLAALDLPEATPEAGS